MILVQSRKGVSTVLEFIGSNWPMLLCFIGGIAMLVLEAFMPGFGLPGLSGIVLEGVAIWLCWKALGPSAALIMVVIALAVLAVAISMSLRSATKGRLSRSSVILNETESDEAGYRATEDLQSFCGMTGEATTVLRPTGMAVFDGVKLNVISDGEFIAAGTKVVITSVEGSRILVKSQHS